MEIDSFENAELNQDNVSKIENYTDRQEKTGMDVDINVGVIGLSVMGGNLVKNIANKGFPVCVWNLETEVTKKYAEENKERITPTYSLKDFVANIQKPRNILVMIRAGDPVDSLLQQLVPLLDAGDVVVDCGNSHFSDTERRIEELKEHGIHFSGLGVSGGEKGALNGPSLMYGGDESTWNKLGNLFELISAKSTFGACATYIGAGGSGHFVKMAHNGIEYGDMQIIAEIYDVLRHCAKLSCDEIAEIFDEWNEGILGSYLVEITGQILRKKEEKLGGHLVDYVLDVAEQKGTGRWAVESAMALNVPVPTMSSAIEARNMSFLKDERMEAASYIAVKEFSSYASSNEPLVSSAEIIEMAKDAFIAARICGYAQGLHLIDKYAQSRGIELKRDEILKVWVEGCIIKASLLEVLIGELRKDIHATNLILLPNINEKLSSCQKGWRSFVQFAISSGISTPVISSSLNYFDAYRREITPQNLTQAQRDAFGAHTYVRTDSQGEKIHSEWLSE